jgi:hypothetical protein
MVLIHARFVSSVRFFSDLFSERRFLVFETLLLAEAQPMEKLEVILLTIDEIIRRRQHATRYLMIRSASYSSRFVPTVET